MPKTFKYTVRQGDTLEDLSTRFYGVPAEYPRILKANPKLSKQNLEIFQGQEIIIPSKQPVAITRTEIESSDDSVVVRVNGIDYKSVWAFKLELSIERAADVFSFQLPWDKDDPSLIANFQPFQYQDVEIFIAGTLRLTGNILNVVPQVSTDSRILKISGYSKCGVLNDCMLPIASYPPVFQSATFFDICSQLAEAFDIEVTDSVGDNFPFEEVDIKATDKVYSFLAKLAKKRGILITSDVEGNLIIQKATEEKAKFT